MLKNKPIKLSSSIDFTDRYIEQLKSTIKIFTTLYCIVISIFFAIIAYPQYLKASDTFLFSNIFSTISVLGNLKFGVLMQKTAISFVKGNMILLPLISIYYLSYKIAKMLDVIDHDRNFVRGMNLSKLLKILIKPLCAWFFTGIITIVLCASVKSLNGMLFATGLFTIPILFITLLVYYSISFGNDSNGSK